MIIYCWANDEAHCAGRPNSPQRESLGLDHSLSICPIVSWACSVALWLRAVAGRMQDSMAGARAAGVKPLDTAGLKKAWAELSAELQAPYRDMEKADQVRSLDSPHLLDSVDPLDPVGSLTRLFETSYQDCSPTTPARRT